MRKRQEAALACLRTLCARLHYHRGRNLLGGVEARATAAFVRARFATGRGQAAALPAVGGQSAGGRPRLACCAQMRAQLRDPTRGSFRPRPQRMPPHRLPQVVHLHMQIRRRALDAHVAQ